MTKSADSQRVRVVASTFCHGDSCRNRDKRATDSKRVSDYLCVHSIGKLMSTVCTPTSVYLMFQTLQKLTVSFNSIVFSLVQMETLTICVLIHLQDLRDFIM